MKFFFIGLTLLITQVSCGQSVDVVFYNVENLFDTINDPKTDDESFLPSSKSEWNSSKYLEKLSHIDQVLKEFDNLGLAAFAEVENKLVLSDLVKKYNSKFQIVHQDSPDERGIDVAMIYNPKLLRLRSMKVLPIKLNQDGKEDFTRDILVAEFFLKKEIIYVMVNHWPSRRGGEQNTEPARMTAANVARKYIDSVYTANPKANIIFMGDLNDTPENKSVSLIKEKLTQKITPESGSHKGTNEYKGEWQILDHILVSPGMETNKKCLVREKGRILESPYLFETYKGHQVPFRTYAGKYLGGYSDHLPVSIEIFY